MGCRSPATPLESRQIGDVSLPERCAFQTNLSGASLPEFRKMAHLGQHRGPRPWSLLANHLLEGIDSHQERFSIVRRMSR